MLHHGTYIQKLRADVAGLMHKARYGDPLVVGAAFAGAGIDAAAVCANF